MTQDFVYDSSIDQDLNSRNVFVDQEKKALVYNMLPDNKITLTTIGFHHAVERSFDLYSESSLCVIYEDTCASADVCCISKIFLK